VPVGPDAGQTGSERGCSRRGLPAWGGCKHSQVISATLLSMLLFSCAIQYRVPACARLALEQLIFDSTSLFFDASWNCSHPLCILLLAFPLLLEHRIISSRSSPCETWNVDLGQLASYHFHSSRCRLATVLTFLEANSMPVSSLNHPVGTAPS
jgi:hypothetical protein